MPIPTAQVKGIPEIVVLNRRQAGKKFFCRGKKFLKKVLADSKSFMYSDLRL